MKEECKLQKKDFIPIYGLIKYYDRIIPEKINPKTSLKDSLTMEVSGFVLSVYNIGVMSAATGAVIAATVGLEAFLK